MLLVLLYARTIEETKELWKRFFVGQKNLLTSQFGKLRRQRNIPIGHFYITPGFDSLTGVILDSQ